MAAAESAALAEHSAASTRGAGPDPAVTVNVTIPHASGVVIHYPGYIRDLNRALETLGGEAALCEAVQVPAYKHMRAYVCSPGCRAMLCTHCLGCEPLYAPFLHCKPPCIMFTPPSSHHRGKLRRCDCGCVPRMPSATRLSASGQQQTACCCALHGGGEHPSPRKVTCNRTSKAMQETWM